MKPPENAQEIRNKITVMEAYLAGKAIQFKSNKYDNIWQDANSLSFNCEGYEYRIKPIPRYRAWTSEEVPVGSLIRWTGQNDSRTVIVGLSHPDKDIQWLNGHSDRYIITATQDALIRCEHSLDQGKTWLPCGVLVSE